MKKKQSFKSRAFNPRVFLAFILCSIGASLAIAAVVTELVPGTAVLLNQSGGGGGNGGNTSSTTSKTNIFSPSSYVDYKRLGGEPTVIVDRYPFPGTNIDPAAQCPTGQITCFKDLNHYTAPLGLGSYSYVWKSDDLAKTWRLPLHEPVEGRASGQGEGGGDSHQAVGEVTHKVFFLDLPGPCETINISSDLGETWSSDPLGCGDNPGAIDDRQWIATDESYPGSQNVYISFIQVFDLEGNVPPWPTLALARSPHDGINGSFNTDSTCNLLTGSVGGNPINSVPGNLSPVPDSQITACPDPGDFFLWVAGPVVVDKEGYSGRPTPSHRVYIPFMRAAGFHGGAPWQLYIARSDDGGSTWVRHPIATRQNNPSNIFVQMTVDRGGNLYYTWSEERTPAGEQDIYYAFSTTGGETWSPPIPLTQETGDSAVFPWMVAGDPGQVDLVYYKSNSGLNSNVSFIDANGNPCPDPQIECGGKPNPAIWQTYFGQSQNALNTGSNFKSVQITDHPIHTGSVSTGGLGGNADRSLLDFLTVDVDHYGAAVVSWADDNNSRRDTRNKSARQISGNSVYKNQTIGLQQSWPIRDHSVSDPAGDVRTALGAPPLVGTGCPSMDVLSTATSRSGDLLTVSMTLSAPPSAANAIACGGPGVTGAIWGAEFWASSAATSLFGGGPNANFYVAYRDNPGDPTEPMPGVEGGRVDAYTVLTNEFHREVPGVPVTASGTCFAGLPPTPCTVTMTVSLSSLGIKSGSGLYSITGGSFYFFGGEDPVPETRVPMGFSNQADVTAALDDNGTGTTK
jgi:hypothetical protein